MSYYREEEDDGYERRGQGYEQYPQDDGYGYEQRDSYGGGQREAYGGQRDVYGGQQQQYNGYQEQGYQQQGYSTRQAPPPPQGMVSFGQGAPQDYSFQYSNCTGRRRALLIGINYFGQDAELRGCINDVHNMSGFLEQNFGYQRQDMVILTDDQQNPMSIPTRDNMLRAMSWLVSDVQPNDSLFFHYSGHGGQTEDLDGDEDDGQDEVIYPVDYNEVGPIVDDQLHQIMVTPLPAGARLTCIFDSCHSGSVLDLPYIYSTHGVLKEPNLAKEAGEGLLGAFTSYESGDLSGAASSLMGFFKKATTGDEAYQQTVRTKTSPADVVMWSGSKDDQTSADATIASKATGAMSWAFITAMNEKGIGQQSYVELLNNIRDVLATKYEQKPQLSCSHPLGMFVLDGREATANVVQIQTYYSSCRCASFGFDEIGAEDRAFCMTA